MNLSLTRNEKLAEFKKPTRLAGIELVHDSLLKIGYYGDI